MPIIKKSALIVEDEPIPARNLKEHLEEHGYTITGICTTGEDAILKARETPPDIILMDIRLKGEMDGVTAYQNINQYLDVPVIYLSAYGDEKTLERAKKTGTFDFINKPARMADIDSAIAMAFYKHQMGQELKQAKEALENAIEAKSRVIDYISQEVRNPMNVIKGLAELFEQTQPSPVQKKYLRRLRTSFEKILETLNQIQDISKIEAGKLILDKRDFSLSSVLDSVIEINATTAERKNIELHKMIAVDIPELLIGDPMRLWQCINNLVDNALKFTEKGFCKLKVHLDNSIENSNSCDKNKISLVFSVEDSGVGIPEAYQKRVFDSDAQVGISNAKKFGGTGLGLTFTKLLVRQMGGKISVNSIPEKGSTFTFSAAFDRSETLGKNYPDKIPKLSRKKLQPLRILVADDSVDDQDIITDLLQLHVPHDVTCAFNGKEAIRLHKEKNFDLILMKTSMPVMDGLKATKLIRENQTPGFNSDVPIIALTGHIQVERQLFIQNGITYYLTKPFGYNELNESIQKVLNKQEESSSFLCSGDGRNYVQY